MEIPSTCRGRANRCSDHAARTGGQFDPSMAGVSSGTIYLARQHCEAIPDSWALTPDGARTTDAATAVDGVILPMAGHKGYAISFMMDVLSGALTGAQVGNGVYGPYIADKRSGCGHMFLAIDVATLGSSEEFQAKVETLIADVRATPMARDASEIFYPGEIEDRNDRLHRAEGGLVLPHQTLEDLHLLAEQSGLDATVVLGDRP